MKRDPQRQGKGWLELIEEAIHLLRKAELSALATYYLGTLPFVLGLLYFWADMSRSPFAVRHLADAALGLAALFLWMKFWQVIFLRRLRAALLGTTLPPLTPKQCGRIFVTQAALQPTGLFLLPLALVLTLPFAWVYAFYQNLTALADGESAELRDLARQALRQANLWPRQNHLLLLALSGFGFFIFLNWGTFCFLLPNMVKTLFGVESVFTRNVLGMLNSTFLAALWGLTYLCLDPILKASYALRCFYGQSLRTGEDLRVELKRFVVPGQILACLLVILTLPSAGHAANLAGGAASAGAPAQSEGRLAEANPLAATAQAPLAEASPPAGSVSPPDLDRAIREVAQGRKYAWRMPRAKSLEPEPEQGVIGRFLDRVAQMAKRWLKRVADWLVEVLDKLFRSRRQTTKSPSGYGWIFAKEILVYALVALAAAGLIFLIYYLWRGRQRRAAAVASEPIQVTPDLGDENVGPEQMPEDGWAKLARELAAQGELRLALRAFYLASLAHLAARNLISLAKFKSNRDYERELQRRGHSFPDLLALFGENVSVFDQVWYGLHDLDGEAVNDFAAKVDRIRSGA
jgi:hypothetical protein